MQRIDTMKWNISSAQHRAGLWWEIYISLRALYQHYHLHHHHIGSEQWAIYEDDARRITRKRKGRRREICKERGTEEVNNLLLHFVQVKKTQAEVHIHSNNWILSQLVETLLQLVTDQRTRATW